MTHGFAPVEPNRHVVTPPAIHPFLLLCLTCLVGCGGASEPSSPVPPPLFGRVVFTEVTGTGDVAIFSSDSAGTDIQLLKNVSHLSFVIPRVSPDAQSVAAIGYKTPGGEPQQLYIIAADGSSVRLLPNTIGAGAMSWSPDGSRLVFGCLDPAPGPMENDYAICLINPDGSGWQRVNHSAFASLMPAWSPDGLRFAYVSDSTGGDYDLFTMSVAGNDVREVANTNTWNEWDPVWSPDGSTLAFTRDKTWSDIYVVQASGAGEQQVTSSGGSQPAWSPSGAEIWFDENNQIYAIHPDGTALRQPPVSSRGAFWPSWAPPSPTP
jgi:Tol biopolymer transport system component